MRIPSTYCAITLALILATCVAAQEENPATRAWIPETGFAGEAQVETDGGTPANFTLVLNRDMPTPGWTFHVDATSVESERISVWMTEKAPDGMTAQVITPTKIEIPLGIVRAGVYFVELSTRRNDFSPYQPAHALILIAR